MVTPRSDDDDDRPPDTVNDVAGVITHVRSFEDDVDWVALTAGEATVLSPWQAYWCDREARSLLDLVCGSIEDTGDLDAESLTQWCGLPAVVSRYLEGIGSNESTKWVTLFAVAMATISVELRAGRMPRQPTRGAEMALRSVIARMAHMTADDYDDGLGHPSASPTEQDFDFDALDGILFDDDDMLFLFDQAFDGVEDPGSEFSVQLASPDLHPARWFIDTNDAFDVVTVDVDDDMALVECAQACLDRHIGARLAVAIAVAERSPDAVSVAAMLPSLRIDGSLAVQFEVDDGEVLATVLVWIGSADGNARVGIPVVDLKSLAGLIDIP